MLKWLFRFLFCSQFGRECFSLNYCLIGDTFFLAFLPSVFTHSVVLFFGTVTFCYVVGIPFYLSSWRNIMLPV
jgi:hypothetical protein